MKTAHQKVRDVPIRRNPTGPSNRLLPSSFPGLRNPAPAQHQTKIGPTSDHLELINDSASTIYNFRALERSDFHLTRAVSQPPRQSRSKPVQNLYTSCTKGWLRVQV